MDASLAIGHGHVMRCLTLATALSVQGIRSTFVCREHQGNLCDLIEQKGFAVCRLPIGKTAVTSELTLLHVSWLAASWAEDATQTAAAIATTGLMPTWLIVDHYALDARWEMALRQVTKNIMVIDDLADRQHDAEILLDQNLYPDMALRYAGLVSKQCHTLVGPGYALLRREFSEARLTTSPPRTEVRKIFVSFGGSDLTNETQKSLTAIAALNSRDISVDVVVGSGNAHCEAIAEFCRSMKGVRFHCQVDNMSQLMMVADLALGAGGSTTWERCALGLPALVVSVADNQVAIADGVDKAGAHRHLGLAKDVTVSQLIAAIDEVRNEPEILEKMSRAARMLVDGRGCERVISIMKGFA